MIFGPNRDRKRDIVEIVNEDFAPMSDNTFSKYLYDRRTKAGLSLRELSRLLGTSHSYLSRLEAGEQSNPSTEFLLRLADVLHIEDVAELLALFGADPVATLPPAQTYFRRKYGLSEHDAALLAHLVEDYAKLHERTSNNNQGENSNVQ
ncbi:helix-turn-helix domain-containing protein [Amycolatopsis sp. CA-126428]|uniref:helix-turn-helix domain-containing protein n=1 Tax=Amycolatopsis sp. CA-126428 TaxID=2073158 RepID=UPI001304C970|nr:helix-turn-helix transcriptional regulator [Amycolatopsis sp. CA-126428]